MENPQENFLLYAGERRINLFLEKPLMIRADSS